MLELEFSPSLRVCQYNYEGERVHSVQLTFRQIVQPVAVCRSQVVVLTLGPLKNGRQPVDNMKF